MSCVVCSVDVVYSVMVWIGVEDCELDVYVNVNVSYWLIERK